MSVHIEAKKGEIAETILLHGDPLRAKWIAETFFENPVCFNKIRNMIKIFRKIHQTLIMENKTSKYFTYVIGEIV